MEMTKSERLESIKNKLYDFGKSVWDISEDDYMWLYQQSERAIITEQLAENLGALNEYLQNSPQLTDLRWGESVSLIAIDVMSKLEDQNKRLHAALQEILEVDEHPQFKGNILEHNDYLDQLIMIEEVARKALDK